MVPRQVAGETGGDIVKQLCRFSVCVCMCAWLHVLKNVIL